MARNVLWLARLGDGHYRRLVRAYRHDAHDREIESLG